MRLSLSKKKFFISIFLFFVLLIGGVYLLLSSRGSEVPVEVSSYELLMDYCDHEEDGDVLSIICNSFIGDEYVNDDGERCLNFLVISEKGGSREDIELCIDSEKMEWENPYPDYSLYVPVVLEIDYEINRKFQITSVRGSLMGDEVVVEILERVPFSDKQNIPVWTALHEEAVEKSYDTILEEDGAGDFAPVGISIWEGRVISYDVQGELINIEIETFFKGRDSGVSFSTEGFYLWDNLKEEGEEETYIDSSNIADLDLGVSYRVILLLEDPLLFSEDFVDEQLDLLARGEPNDFLLNRISIVYEE